MKEIKLLFKKANRYIKSAQILIEEKDYDSAVSRAYYAMFFATEALLLTKNLTFSSHKGIISNFAQYFVKTNIFPKKYYKILVKGFEKRQIGDYDFEPMISKSDAVSMLKESQEFVESVTDYLKKK